MSNKVTIKDIAQRASASLSTVNKALTGKPGISKERREEILKISKELGYVSNSVAQSLARHSIVVGVILPDKWSDYFGEISDGMNEEFKSLEKYKIESRYYWLSDRDVKNDAFLKAWLHEEKVKCIIYCSSAHESSEMVEKVLEKASLPLFQIGERILSGAVSTVMSDVDFSGRLAADFIFSIRKKDTRAAIFTGFLNMDSHRRKVDAFKKRLDSYGGKTVAVCETLDDDATTEKCIEELLARHPEVNSIFVSTAMSTPICKYLDTHSLGGQITVVGTDVFKELREYIKKGVMQATIFQEQRLLGKKVVRNVYNYLFNENSFGHENLEVEKELLIKPSLYLLANIE